MQPQLFLQEGGWTRTKTMKDTRLSPRTFIFSFSVGESFELPQKDTPEWVMVGEPWESSLQGLSYLPPPKASRSWSHRVEGHWAHGGVAGREDS